MNVLITGFEPFGGEVTNPSQQVIQALLRELRLTECKLVGEVLRTEYAASAARVAQLLTEHRPDVYIALGVSGASVAITLERFAINVNDCSAPDNAGDRAIGRAISHTGPQAYRSTLPIEAMRDALVARGIPCTVSNHAGAYVCNHVFYVARDGIERLSLPTLCGFIHVPPVEKLPLEMSIDAIGECITLACAAKKNAGRG